MNNPNRSVLLTIGAIVLFFLLAAWHGWESHDPNRHLKNIAVPDLYELSKKEVYAILDDYKSSYVSNLQTVSLEPGDILIRQLRTPRTAFLEDNTDLFFTHSAIYLGSNEIAEAIGYEDNPANDILVHRLSETNWYDQEAKWVIIRPLLPTQVTKEILSDIRTIANDDNYTFGLSDNQREATTRVCSDLIYYPFAEELAWSNLGEPAVITTDFMVEDLLNRTDQFSLIATNIK